VSVSGFTWHPRLTKSHGAVYAGLELSAVDWIAPFTELALRRVDAGYSNPGCVFLEFVKPRIDVVLGVPAFTSHLAVSLGASMRIAAPFAGLPGESFAKATANNFTYLSIFSDDSRVDRNYSSFAEFNAGLHYVF
jgi:hypothetical protein